MLADDLPNNFAPYRNPTNFLRLDAELCDKVAIDGRDLGPAVFMLLMTPIKEPAGAPKGNHSESWYLFEARANSAAVVSWLTRGRVLTSEGIVTHRDSPHSDPLWTTEFETFVTGGTDATYHSRAAPEKAVSKYEYIIRMYYGPDATRDYLEASLVYMSSRATGPGVMEFGSQSAISKILSGSTTMEMIGSNNQGGYRAIR